MNTGEPVLVVGIGNCWRGDDAAGLLVAEQVALLQLKHVEIRRLESPGPELMDLWQQRQAVFLVDAVISGAPPGTLHRLDLLQQPVQWRAAVSSHALDLPAVIQLAHRLRSLPRHLVLYGIEVSDVGHGAVLTGAVAAALSACADAIVREIVLKN